MKKLLNLNKSTSISIVLCRIVLPLLTIVFLLAMPNFMNRRPVADSKFVDGTVRFLLAVFFCSNYWYLPNLFESKSKRWLGISDFVLKDPILLKGYYTFMTLGYGFFIAWFTWYAFLVFLPAFADYSVPIAIMNGFVFIVFFILRYKSFMKLVANSDV